MEIRFFYISGLAVWRSCLRLLLSVLKIFVTRTWKFCQRDSGRNTEKEMARVNLEETQEERESRIPKIAGVCWSWNYISLQQLMEGFAVPDELTSA